MLVVLCCVGYESIDTIVKIERDSWDTVERAGWKKQRIGRIFIYWSMVLMISCTGVCVVTLIQWFDCIKIYMFTYVILKNGGFWVYPKAGRQDSWQSSWSCWRWVRMRWQVPEEPPALSFHHPNISLCPKSQHHCCHHCLTFHPPLWKSSPSHQRLTEQHCGNWIGLPFLLWLRISGFCP